MPGDPLLIDTWALIALVNRDDAWHQQAVELSRQLNAQARPLVTTDWILSEFLGGAARPPLRQLATQCVEQFRASSQIEVIPATHDDWEKGFALYQARPDKS